MKALPYLEEIRDIRNDALEELKKIVSSELYQKILNKSHIDYDELFSYGNENSKSFKLMSIALFADVTFSQKDIRIAEDYVTSFLRSVGFEKLSEETIALLTLAHLSTKDANQVYQRQEPKLSQNNEYDVSTYFPGDVEGLGLFAHYCGAFFGILKESGGLVFNLENIQMQYDLAKEFNQIPTIPICSLSDFGDFIHLNPENDQLLENYGDEDQLFAGSIDSFFKRGIYAMQAKQYLRFKVEEDFDAELYWKEQFDSHPELMRLKNNLEQAQKENNEELICSIQTEISILMDSLSNEVGEIDAYSDKVDDFSLKVWNKFEDMPLYTHVDLFLD